MVNGCVRAGAGWGYLGRGVERQGGGGLCTVWDGKWCACAEVRRVRVLGWCTRTMHQFATEAWVTRSA